MTDQHPLIPTAELRCQWQSESPHKVISVEREDYMINRAAQWGADQELKACCKALGGEYNYHQLAEALHNHRRPMSLKEQAINAALKLRKKYPSYEGADIELIIRTLESLPDNG